MNVGRGLLPTLICSILLSGGNAAFADIVTLQGSTYSDYNDSGQLLYQVAMNPANAYTNSSFLGSLQFTTSYTDSTVFQSRANHYLPGSTVVNVNFLDSSNLMTITNVGILGSCFQYCGAPPTVPYPFTISPDGSSISGEVGECGGIPHCTENGYAVGYYLDIHFSNPVYGVFGITSAESLLTTTNPYSDPTYSLLYSQSIYGFYGDSPATGGWLFPNGISDLYVTSTSPNINGTNGFTLSNFEVVTDAPTPEPASVFYCAVALSAIALFVGRHRASLRTRSERP